MYFPVFKYLFIYLHLNFVYLPFCLFYYNLYFCLLILNSFLIFIYIYIYFCLIFFFYCLLILDFIFKLKFLTIRLPLFCTFSHIISAIQCSLMPPDLLLHRFKCTAWNDIKQVDNYFRWSPKKIPAVPWARRTLGLRSFWVCFPRRTGTTTACLISWPTETSEGFSVWPGKEDQVISGHPF